MDDLIKKFRNANPNTRQEFEKLSQEFLDALTVDNCAYLLESIFFNKNFKDSSKALALELIFNNDKIYTVLQKLLQEAEEKGIIPTDREARRKLTTDYVNKVVE